MLELKITASSPEDMAQQLAFMAAKFGQPGVLQVTVGAGGSGGANTDIQAQDSGGAAPKAERKSASGKTTEAKVEEQKTDTVATAVEADPPQGDEGADALTYENHVKPAILRLSMAKGRDAVMKVLGEFPESTVNGKASAANVPQAKWGALIERVETEMAA